MQKKLPSPSLSGFRVTTGLGHIAACALKAVGDGKKIKEESPKSAGPAPQA